MACFVQDTSCASEVLANMPRPDTAAVAWTPQATHRAFRHHHPCSRCDSRPILLTRCCCWCCCPPLLLLQMLLLQLLCSLARYMLLLTGHSTALLATRCRPWVRHLTRVAAAKAVRHWQERRAAEHSLYRGSCLLTSEQCVCVCVCVPACMLAVSRLPALQCDDAAKTGSMIALSRPVDGSASAFLTPCISSSALQGHTVS